MGEIYRFDVHEDYMPRGTPLPIWENPPGDPNRYGELPPGPIDPGFSSDGLGTGFPPSMPRPLVKYSKKLGRTPPADIYMASRDTFTVSDRSKRLFEQIDPGAFVFVEADTIMPDGSAGPKHWVMDVVRTVNALDETWPGVEITASGRAAYKSDNNVFREDRLVGVHVFRLAGGYAKLCDAEFKDAVEEAGLIGFIFGRKGRTQ